MGAAVLDGQVIDADLAIRRLWYSRYAVDLRVQQPDSDTDTFLQASLEPLDLRELESLRADPVAYGNSVGTWLLKDGAREIFGQIEAVANAANTSIRLRISFDDGAAELHRVHWEMARSPDTGRLLFVGENILFSRYIRTSDFRRLQRRSRAQLRALVAVASPAELQGMRDAAGRKLASVDPAAELTRATECLAGIPAGTLRNGGRATLDNIANTLRADAPDILYLVCHGALIDRQPRLWLEKPDGSIDDVAAEDFVTRLVELRNRPSLIVLASCQSAGTGASDDDTLGDDGVLSALGPRLAAEGVPAVLAMQGDITLRTMRAFMTRFFTELGQHGQLDTAASFARGDVRARPDFWTPVLFSRLKGGGIWYRSGWDSRDSQELMPGLKRAIDDGKCTPIIGPGVLDNIEGSRREIARDLSARLRFSLNPQDRDDLPQVAQYQSVEDTRDTMIADYLRVLVARIQSRYRDALPAELQGDLPKDASTTEIRDRCLALLDLAWEHRQGKQPAGRESPEPYSLLAKLPFSAYISTNGDELLEKALARSTLVVKDVTGQPQVVTRAARSELFRWSTEFNAGSSVFEANPKAEFEPREPLVYHLFGKLSTPDSLVLTQDDYFDALIAASGQDRLPQAVRGAFSNKTLLFLGFNIDDWNFRVLFRFIVNLPSVSLLGRHKHVAVQIDPEEQRFSDPKAAARYLSRYFQAKQIHIYWGTVDDFVRDLHQMYDAKPGPAPAPRPAAAGTP